MGVVEEELRGGVTLPGLAIRFQRHPLSGGCVGGVSSHECHVTLFCLSCSGEVQSVDPEERRASNCSHSGFYQRHGLVVILGIHILFSRAASSVSVTTVGSPTVGKTRGSVMGAAALPEGGSFVVCPETHSHLCTTDIF